ncbi:LAME_0F06084g1_1 [Lachancea meyersii CBS 8951]|uniref:LAME_0F06084g1_1 n=1 Tax=Lachancea meyersii CBS 8951 TaxID=1266667 RepID=A0A1G4JT69_9SACH|nr:LAME_0F06084g1_1 [Lachancea meyersii CBS 8951]
MRTGMWLVAVLGYVIQTKAISHVYSLTDPEKQQSSSHQEALCLLFAHLSAWTVMAPLTELFSRLKSGSLGGNGPRFTEMLPVTISAAVVTDEELFLDNDSLPRATGTLRTQLKRLLQVVVLASLLIVAGYTFLVALRLSPALDVAMMHNTSMFEIVSLLLVVAGVAPRKHLVRNFALMVVILAGIFIVSYTKATSDLLSGKLSVNESTGELDDPFLFDRLKGALTCGLGALTIGPFFVLWSKWSATAQTGPVDSIRPYLTHRERTRISNFEISQLGVMNLLILGPLLFFSGTNNLWAQCTWSKSAWILVSVFAGHLPMIWALVNLSDRVSPQYASTCFVGAIVFMAAADCISETTQIIVTRWEVIGYLMISVAGLLLGRRYLSTAKTDS